MQDMALLHETLETGRALFDDIGSLNRQIHVLFHLDNTPTSTTELQALLREAGQIAREVYLYAMRTQTLMMTLQRTLAHFAKLMAQLSILVGNKQGHQVAMQAHADLSRTLKMLEMQTASFHRAQSVQKSMEPITMEALYRIQEQLMADWPRGR
jgi:nanoRNase/pAp phosphatase (c-di-AMP/oligoRNAs hydrolase)